MFLRTGLERSGCSEVGYIRTAPFDSIVRTAGRVELPGTEISEELELSICLALGGVS